MEGKVCSKCHKLKPYSEYHHSSTSKDGYKPRCKECISEDGKKWYYEEGGQLSEKVRQATYYLNNKEKENARCKCTTREQHLANRIRTQRYYAKKRSLPHDLTTEQWEYTLTVLGNECVYCGGLNQVQEHVVPLSKGGGYVFGNIVPSCARCNNSKNNMPMIDWYVLQPYFSMDRLLKVINFVSRKEVINPRD